jgi:hypothetical protein
VKKEKTQRKEDDDSDDDDSDDDDDDENDDDENDDDGSNSDVATEFEPPVKTMVVTVCMQSDMKLLIVLFF